MPRRRNLWLFLAAVALGVNLAVGYRVYSQDASTTGESEAFEKISIMMRVLHLIRQDYVDPEKVDFPDLIYGAIEGMVGSLDPFSGFMRPDAYQDMMESTEGEFGGLGIVVTVEDGILTIVTPMEDTPGSRAGLRPGDQIIQVEEETTKDMDLHDAVKRLKGEPGTSVTITIFRPETEETKEITLERALIEVPSVKDERVIADTIGYLRITQFNEPTAERLADTVEQLTEKEIDGLVIDLRNNPGGLLNAAVDACSLFLPSKKLVVFTEGRRPSQKHQFFSGRGAKYPELPLTILVNRGSASAAEIMAGCLQDWNRATLVGEKTFGKGSVQNVIELPDGSALRLTTAKYYTPSERVIHGNGIEPDMVVKLTDEELRQLFEAQMDATTDAVPEVDRQLQKAVEVLKNGGPTAEKSGEKPAEAPRADATADPSGKTAEPARAQ